MSFEDLGLSPETLKAVAEVGYENPTPIQEQAIPYILMNRDILGIAQTGTGKTASFTLPMIEILAAGRARARMPRSLIIAPTRELAAQVAENFELYGKYHKLSMALLIGGSSFIDQQKALDKGVDVLIATPGRLLDLFERGKILLTDVKILVIDEADRMLDMGFIPDVERIVSLLPKIRQTLFFSATMPPEVKRLADVFLINPKEVKVSRPAQTASTVVQGLIVVPPRGKRDALRRILEKETVKNALIFCNRKRDVSELHRTLGQAGHSVAQLHGDMPQSARTETLAKFKNDEVALLVCSDVAARGIDISALSHVFNYDVPTHPEDYVHRIGRTGRAGMEGHAFTIATAEDGRYVSAIEKIIGGPIPRVELDGVDTTDLSEGEERPRGGRGRGERGRGRGGSDKPRERKAQEPSEKAPQASAPPPQEKAPPREKAREAPRRDRKRNSRDTQVFHDIGTMDHGDKVTGFGSHTPSFLNPAPAHKKEEPKNKAPARSKKAETSSDVEPS